jgi:hypothetical protein
MGDHMQISQITRRDIVDAIAVEKINWSGRMEEPSFYHVQSIETSFHRWLRARRERQRRRSAAEQRDELAPSLSV